MTSRIGFFDGIVALIWWRSSRQQSSDATTTASLEAKDVAWQTAYPLDVGSGMRKCCKYPRLELHVRQARANHSSALHDPRNRSRHSREPGIGCSRRRPKDHCHTPFSRRPLYVVGAFPHDVVRDLLMSSDLRISLQGPRRPRETQRRKVDLRAAIMSAQARCAFKTTLMEEDS